MLTPRFEIEQTDNEVTIIVRAPLANIKDTEVFVDGTDFRFFSSPYYLRLNLPGEIEENDASSGKYDCDKGDFTLKFSKVHKGEFFENLDMITNLLAPKKQKSNGVPTIEVISNPCAGLDENISKQEEEKNDLNEAECDADADDEWLIEQKIPEEPQVTILAPRYGFANKLSNMLTTFEDVWLKEIIDLPEPDKTLVSDRKILRDNHETSAFDEEHYLADYVEEDIVEPYLEFKIKCETKEDESKFTDDEKDILKELPNKEFLMDEKETNIALLGMVDILYASCYNHRTTCGENTVESGWTINKLSSTLSWFQSFEDIHETVRSCLRRSLCYPMVRNWNLSMKVLDDLKQVLKQGKKCVIKHFCQIHHIFNTSNEPRYVLNQLYIKDYLIWLQQVPNDKFEEVYKLLLSVNPMKEEMKFDLVELEIAADSVKKENLIIENNVSDITQFLKETTLENGNSKEIDPDDSGTSDSSSDSSDDSSDSSSSSLDSDDEPVKH